MTSGDALTKITEWFDRDGLVEQVISQQKEPTPAKDLDISIHPEVLAIQALTDDGQAQVNRYQEVINPSYLLRLASRPQYIEQR